MFLDVSKVAMVYTSFGSSDQLHLVTPGGGMRQAEYVPCEACPLRTRPYFKPFSKAELRFVSSLKADHVRAQAGEDIIEAGTPKSGIYTLWEGWAFRYKSLPGGSRQILDFLLPGELIGLDGWPNGGINAYSVQALTPVSLCVLHGRPLDHLFARHADMAVKLLDRALE